MVYEKEVHVFLELDDNSRCMPGKAYVKKKSENIKRQKNVFVHTTLKHGSIALKSFTETRQRGTGKPRNICKGWNNWRSATKRVVRSCCILRSGKKYN